MIVARLLSLVLAILAVPAIAAAQVFTTYDAFGGPLSPALWAGLETNTNFAVISNTETQRSIVRPDPLSPNRFLQMGLTTGHPGSGSDSGQAGEGRQRLRIVRDDIIDGTVAVTAFRTRVVMLSSSVTSCPTTTDDSPTRAMAHVHFFFFNDGSTTGPGDGTGDIIAGFNVEHDSRFGRIISIFVTRCANAACSTLGPGKNDTFTRRWSIGAAVPLSVVWDRATSAFVYTAGTEQRVLTYADLGWTDTTPPVFDVRDIQIRNVLPNCSTPVRASAVARYDFLHLATETGVFP